MEDGGVGEKREEGLGGREVGGEGGVGVGSEEEVGDGGGGQGFMVVELQNVGMGLFEEFAASTG